MQINLSYDSSTQSAPAGFFTAMSYVVNYLDSLITNNMGVNITVGWGEENSQSLGSSLAEGGPDSGVTLSYAQLKSDLLAHSSSPTDAYAYANLPTTDISNGNGLYISAAQEKAWGLLPSNGTEIDGSVGFATSYAWAFDPNNRAVAGDYDFIGVALHELTHALGRVSGLQPGWSLTVMDLFQYAKPGVVQTNSGSPDYFSINGGVTNLNNFSTTSDLGDWAKTVPNDSFDAYCSPGVVLAFSQTDIALMNVLGFKVATQSGATTSSVIAQTDNGAAEVGIGHVITLTLNSSAAEIVTGAPTLQLNDNEVATYVSGSGANALQFSYTVQAGDNTSDLQVTGLNLPSGATIQDTYGNNLPSNVTADLGIQINTTAPVVTKVVATTDDGAHEVGIGHVITIILNTSEAETVTGAPTLQLNDNGVASYVSGSGGSSLEFIYTVQPGDNVSDLKVTGLNLPSGSTIHDAYGNNLASTVTGDLGLQIVTLVTNLQSSEDHLVYLMYQAAYARIPDYTGFEYWAAVADAQQLSALQLADAFIAAPEFITKFGANPSNSAYVTELYTNVLGRAPDPAGLDYWIAQANVGQARDQLLVDFATSPENIQTTGPHTAHGYWVT